ncbi:MAG: hypothetical protein GWM92_14210 [Gemmatimonadetes bacterium]|nr:hypothetical protein [Gemmatimonadota bacterium]NIR79886.1 hypothetical protein [Gemmatimonadota bacterium]NIT88603.1 hypothetical protein [Gemmatimonadota bacterium]NIU30615.1 hypothetical protein [Gemmatimonadota bacterium]NIU36923.1 hypothetical protein [Gemmatimonadota bacterium]
MKFLCIECDEVMEFAERQLPGDGTMAAVFACGSCGREMAMLTNPMETRLVSSMGVKVGGRSVPEQPMELTRTSLEGARPEAFEEAGHEAAPATDEAAAAPAPGRSAGGGAQAVTWSADATERLHRVPRFVRGMVKRIYTDWAREREIATITPEIMDRARSELGLEGM